jgi:hypothetical protein
MDRFANALIDALGGPAAVASKTRNPVRTVHNWRKNGLSPARLDHLCRVAQDESPSVDVPALAAEYGVAILPNGPAAARSPENATDIFHAEQA